MAMRVKGLFATMNIKRGIYDKKHTLNFRDKGFRWHWRLGRKIVAAHEISYPRRRSSAIDRLNPRCTLLMLGCKRFLYIV